MSPAYSFFNGINISAAKKSKHSHSWDFGADPWFFSPLNSFSVNQEHEQGMRKEEVKQINLLIDCSSGIVALGVICPSQQGL